jgi:hypothetical protein
MKECEYNFTHNEGQKKKGITNGSTSSTNMTGQTGK